MPLLSIREVKVKMKGFDDGGVVIVKELIRVMKEKEDVRSVATALLIIIWVLF